MNRTESGTDAAPDAFDDHTAAAPAVRPLRWGILGAGRIARKMAVASIRAGGGEVVAVAASSEARARIFAEDFAISSHYGDYQAVVDAGEVEAVYLPLANGLHFRWALACARAGKHCLCEKPLALTAAEARQLREAFGQAGCRLMEGFAWRHHAQTAWIERQLREGEIGELRRIRASYSMLLDRPGDYRWLDEQGGGSLWDLGCYCVSAMRHFFGLEPVVVSARSRPLRSGAVTDCSTVAWLDFDKDRLGLFESSYTAVYEQRMTLVGTAGSISIERPFPGLGAATLAQLKVDELVTEQRYEPVNAFEAMFDHFTRAARDPSFALQPAEDGLAQALVMEALATSAGQGGVPVAVMPH